MALAPYNKEMMDRKLVQDVYIRICRDGGFQLDWETAARLTANILGITPMMVYLAFSYLDRMKDIAEGTDMILNLNKKEN